MPVNERPDIAIAASGAGQTGEGGTARPSMAYAWIVLIFLTLTNLLGFMDRYLINILAQPIKVEAAVVSIRNRAAFIVASFL